MRALERRRSQRDDVGSAIFLSMNVIKKSLSALSIALLAISLGMVQAATLSIGSPPSFQREPINISRLAGNSSILFIGDDHTQVGIKEFVTHHLSDFRQIGFTCLAVEMVPDHLQPALDAWDLPSQQRILKHLQVFWGEKGAGIPESIFRLIQAAKQQGWMVVAIDPTVSPVDRQRVNPAWASCLRHCLRRHSRVVVFGGRFHFEDRRGSVVAMLQEQSRVAMTRVEFASPDDERALERDLWTARLLDQPVSALLHFSQENTRLGMQGQFMARDSSSDFLASAWFVRLSSDNRLASLQ